MNLRLKFVLSIVLLGLLCLMLPGSIRADTVNINSINANNSPFFVDISTTNVLAQYGITLANVTPGTTVAVLCGQCGGNSIVPSSPPNALTQFGNDNGMSYTLQFSTPLSTLSFNLAGNSKSGGSGTVVAAWSATAFNASGGVLSSVGDPSLFSTFSPFAPQPFTLTGPGIASVTFFTQCFNFCGTVLNIAGLSAPEIKLKNPTCQVNVTPAWSQGDPRWATKTYNNYNPDATVCVRGDDTTNCHIKKLGCALTTIAMALNFAGGSTIPGTGIALDPGSLNDFMKLPNSLFTANHDVDWDPTAHAIKSTLNFQKDFADSQSTSDLDQILCGTHYGKSLPAVVGVHLSNGTPQHFVLVTGKVSGQYQIIDPGDHTNATLDINDFVIRGVITDPFDNSAIDLAVGTNAELLVINGAGQRTGFDSTSGTTFHEIPNSSHFIDSLQDDETGAPAVGASHFVDVAQPPSGPYIVELSGLQLGQFAVTVHTFATDGSKLSDEQFVGITSPSLTSTFALGYVSTPGSPSVITRIASFESTLADVANSLQLGLIDNSGIANSLTQKLLAAQDATGSARNNILEAFKNEMTAQSGKHINGLAPQVLIEDADSLINQNKQ